MPNLLLVMVGGAIGAGLRFEVGRLALRQFGPGFPWGTLIVNLVGGFCAGLLVGLLVREGLGGEPVRLFVGLGLLGGFTTFSAFSLETFNMIARGQYGVAGLYAAASVAGSVLALWLGLVAVKAAA
ncbi:MAG: fluoride efflux transporter CrcB [Allosphingosinicella sp.]|uniref:fluoride efflux transporter CrcB n=1 Tax=Allosphingosinicella sp. TaxID=2823234 RepID=UPI0039461863